MRPSVVLTLTEPLEAHGQEVHTLTFRSPRATDLGKAGMPFRWINGGLDMNVENIIQLAALLAAVPPSVIGNMELPEYQRVQDIILGFFPSATAPPVAPTETQEQAPADRSLTQSIGMERALTSRGSGSPVRQSSLTSLGTS